MRISSGSEVSSAGGNDGSALNEASVAAAAWGAGAPRAPALARATTAYFNEFFQQVKFEHEDNVVKMKEVLAEIEHKQPSLIKSFKTRIAISRTLLKQRELVEHMLHEGTLIDLDANPIIDDINDRLRKLYLAPVYEAIPFTKAAKRKQAELQDTPMLRSSTTGHRHRLASMLEAAPLHIRFDAYHLPHIETTRQRSHRLSVSSAGSAASSRSDSVRSEHGHGSARVHPASPHGGA